MGQIFSIFDIFNDTCKFDSEEDSSGLLKYYEIPSKSEKSIERRSLIEKQVYKNNRI